jgi:hypothetical protein
MRAWLREEEGRRAIRSRSDGGIPLHSVGPRAGCQIWAGPGRILPDPLEAGLLHFFKMVFFISNSLQNSKMHRKFSSSAN